MLSEPNIVPSAKKELTFAQALNESLREAMTRDPSVFLMGEDIGPYGGLFRVTEGLYQEFGSQRVLDTPITEQAIIGFGVGAAMVGSRPIVELQFSDFMALAMDQIVNQAAKARYMSGGQLSVPLIIRTPVGTGLGSQHTQSLEAWLMHVPGLHIAMPATPYDAMGLLRTALELNDPVLFLEHSMLYSTRGEVPVDPYKVPFGEARIVRQGSDVTVIAVSSGVTVAAKVADELAAEQGVSVEVIDPRTLAPFDMATIVASVQKTNRAIVFHQACRTCGIGAEIGQRIMEEAFDYLDAPVTRVAARDVPNPQAKSLEMVVLPSEQDLKRAINSVLYRSPA
ncbi:MAG: alpha-ketoacid dehydrogenase subunit beta [Phycisphaerales bacterium]|jgi:pyruvate dehydrogenase E1 component beta subunit|nr:alpha-ketoacid dehydrogenase subunit beta [Phycisphaerales bacterium]